MLLVSFSIAGHLRNFEPGTESTPQPYQAERSKRSPALISGQLGRLVSGSECIVCRCVAAGAGDSTVFYASIDSVVTGAPFLMCISS